MKNIIFIFVLFSFSSWGKSNINYGKDYAEYEINLINQHLMTLDNQNIQFKTDLLGRMNNLLEENNDRNFFNADQVYYVQEMAKSVQASIDIENNLGKCNIQDKEAGVDLDGLSKATTFELFSEHQNCSTKLLEESGKNNPIYAFTSDVRKITDKVLYKGLADEVYYRSLRDGIAARIRTKHMFSNEHFTYNQIENEVCKGSIFKSSPCSSDPKLKPLIKSVFKEVAEELQREKVKRNVGSNRENKSRATEKIQGYLDELNSHLKDVALAGNYNGVAGTGYFKGKKKRNKKKNIEDGDDFKLECDNKGESPPHNSAASLAFKRYRDKMNDLLEDPEVGVYASALLDDSDYFKGMRQLSEGPVCDDDGTFSFEYLEYPTDLKRTAIDDAVKNLHKRTIEFIANEHKDRRAIITTDANRDYVASRMIVNPIVVGEVLAKNPEIVKSGVLCSAMNNYLREKKIKKNIGDGVEIASIAIGAVSMIGLGASLGNMARLAGASYLKRKAGRKVVSPWRAARRAFNRVDNTLMRNKKYVGAAVVGDAIAMAGTTAVWQARYSDQKAKVNNMLTQIQAAKLDPKLACSEDSRDCRRKRERTVQLYTELETELHDLNEALSERNLSAIFLPLGIAGAGFGVLQYRGLAKLETHGSRQLLEQMDNAKAVSTRFAHENLGLDKANKLDKEATTLQENFSKDIGGGQRDWDNSLTNSTQAKEKVQSLKERAHVIRAIGNANAENTFNSIALALPHQSTDDLLNSIGRMENHDMRQFVETVHRHNTTSVGKTEKGVLAALEKTAQETTFARYNVPVPKMTDLNRAQLKLLDNSPNADEMRNIMRWKYRDVLEKHNITSDVDTKASTEILHILEHQGCTNCLTKRKKKDVSAEFSKKLEQSCKKG